MILNPLGVPSRMNVGQIFECLMGLAAKHLNTRFKVVPFDEMHGTEASPVTVHKKLQTASLVNDWLFSPQYQVKLYLPMAEQDRCLKTQLQLVRLICLN